MGTGFQRGETSWTVTVGVKEWDVTVGITVNITVGDAIGVTAGEVCIGA